MIKSAINENERSFSCTGRPVNQLETPLSDQQVKTKSAAEAQRDERREDILSAAENCFIQYGFHGTTMQVVAKAAGMSPGNLYRYFPSKNAIVEGLVERDRDEARRRFACLDRSLSFWEQLAQIGNQYFVGEAQSKAALCIEIWAEFTRNPEIDAINRPFEGEVAAQLVEMLDSARARGEVAADIDSAAAAQMILVITNGLYVRAGLRRDNDGADQFQCAMQAIYGLLSGAPVLRRAGDKLESHAQQCTPQNPSL